MLVLLTVSVTKICLHLIREQYSNKLGLFSQKDQDDWTRPKTSIGQVDPQLKLEAYFRLKHNLYLLDTPVLTANRWL